MAVGVGLLGESPNGRPGLTYFAPSGLVRGGTAMGVWGRPPLGLGSMGAPEGRGRVARGEAPGKGVPNQTQAPKGRNIPIPVMPTGHLLTPTWPPIRPRRHPITPKDRQGWKCIPKRAHP